MHQVANPRPDRRARAQPVPFGRAWIRPVRTEADGRTTCGFLVTGKAGRGRPAIVGIAGTFRPSTALFDVARFLADSFDLLLVDMPGFNGSGPAVSARVEVFAAHVADLVAAELAGREVLLLGESFGGIVALAAAARPDFAGVRGFALVDPPLSLAAQLHARAHLRKGIAGYRANAFLEAYMEGDGFIREADPDAWWRRLGDVAATGGVLVLTGGRLDGDTGTEQTALFTREDETRAAACVPDDLAVLRLSQAGHIVLQEAPAAAFAALRDFCLARCAPDLPALGPAAAALARAPDDPVVRARLLRVLRASPGSSRRSYRDVLLALVAARPDDAELSNEILRVVYSLADAEGVGAMCDVLARSSDPNARLWAALHVSNAQSSVGDIDGALATLRAVRFDGPPPPRVASLVLNLEMYATGADDRSVALAKEAGLRTIRALMPPPAQALVRSARGTRPRVGFVSGCFGSRNYTALMIPFLHALADGPLEIELLSLFGDRLDNIRQALPARIAVRELGVLSPETADRPPAWTKAHEALAARELDVLVDLDDSLAPYSPACVAHRPAPVQATWFNMSGPSLDPCFDAAIGPDTLYPPELDAAFPGRLARLPGDLYVFAPETWEGQGMRLPPVGPPPMLANGYPTFGSLSNLYKISDACVALWATVLHAVPGSRLYLGNGLADEPTATARVRAQFARCGIDPARVDIRYHFGWPGYLAGYSNIDIVLGTFPVAGGTTLFEALHLGMPVVSRVGPTSLGRIGRWLAAATGRPGLAHESDGSFVAEAVRLAASPGELAALRAGEPARLRAKSRIDAGRMARAFETLVSGPLARAV